MNVVVSRKALFLQAMLLLPAYAAGSWLASFVFGEAFDFGEAVDGFIGALIFAVMLAVCYGETECPK